MTPVGASRVVINAGCSSVNVQLKDEKRGGNCWPIETVAILHVTSKPDAALRMDAEDEDLIRDSDHTYARSLCQIGVPLSTFVDVVEYIAGFVVRKVNYQHGCDECSVVFFTHA